MKQFADQDQKVAVDDGENQETEGDQATLEVHFGSFSAAATC